MKYSDRWTQFLYYAFIQCAFCVNNLQKTNIALLAMKTEMTQRRKIR
jgi:hypothetical protein